MSLCALVWQIAKGLGLYLSTLHKMIFLAGFDSLVLSNSIAWKAYIYFPYLRIYSYSDYPFPSHQTGFCTHQIKSSQASCWENNRDVFTTQGTRYPRVLSVADHVFGTIRLLTARPGKEAVLPVGVAEKDRGAAQTQSSRSWTPRSLRSLLCLSSVRTTPQR